MEAFRVAAQMLVCLLVLPKTMPKNATKTADSSAFAIHMTRCMQHTHDEKCKRMHSIYLCSVLTHSRALCFISMLCRRSVMMQRDA